MAKKLFSFILAFVLIFSLIPNMPAHGMGEQVEPNEKNQIISDFTASTKADAVIDYELKEWLEILAEQEKLITPEIRASMRESAIKAFEAYGLTNRDFAIKNAKPADYGFKTQKELDTWLAKPYNPYKASALQSDDTPLSMNYSEYALVVGNMFCLRVNGYTQASELAWMIMGNNPHTRLRDWPGGNQEKFVDGLSVGCDAITVTDPVKGTTGCVVDVISLDLSCGKNASIKVGESLTISATTSHSNGQIAIRSTSSNVSISGTTVTGQTEGSASIVVYLVDRPTVCKTVSLTITAPDPTVSFGPTQRMQYYGDPFTLYPTTTPPGLDITWSSYPEGRGYFVGNTFYPTNTGSVQITATITGTNVKSSYIYFINPRNIILPQTEIELFCNFTGYYPLNVSIDHGSIDDISFSVSGNAVSDVIKMNGQPSITVQNVGESLITMTAPGCNESKTLRVTVKPNLFFVNPPSEIRANSSYTIRFYTNSPGEIWHFLSDLDTGDYSNNISDIQSEGNGYYSFVFNTGNAGERLKLEVEELFADQIISLEYTVLPPIQNIYWKTDSNKNLIEIDLFSYSEERYYTRKAYVVNIYNGIEVLTEIIPDYYSDDEDVATVNSNGKVTAIEAGEAVITAKIPNTNISISYTVRVTREELEGFQTDGAALYRVPFTDIGGESYSIPIWVAAITNFKNSSTPPYPISVFNGTADSNNKFYGLSKQGFCNAMSSSKFFYFETHGSNNYLRIGTNELLNDADVSEILGATSLCNTNMIIIAACNSAGRFGASITNASPKIYISMNREVNAKEIEAFMSYLIYCLFTKEIDHHKMTMHDILNELDDSGAYPYVNISCNNDAMAASDIFN